MTMTTEARAVAELIAKHLPPSAERMRVRPMDSAAREWVQILAARHFVEAYDGDDADVALAGSISAIGPVRLRPGGRAIFILTNETRPLSKVASMLRRAGFIRILVEPALDGGIVLARGEPAMTAADRHAQTVQPGSDTVVIAPGQALPRYVFLLVHQEPNARGWETPDPASLTWDAVTVHDSALEQTVLLGFSSLVKAVAFMKPAALSSAIPIVNKMPRYLGETIAAWGLPVLLNPVFEAVSEAARFSFDSPAVRVDPRPEGKVHE